MLQSTQGYFLCCSEFLYDSPSQLNAARYKDEDEETKKVFFKPQKENKKKSDRISFLLTLRFCKRDIEFPSSRKAAVACRVRKQVKVSGWIVWVEWGNEETPSYTYTKSKWFTVSIEHKRFSFWKLSRIDLKSMKIPSRFNSISKIGFFEFCKSSVHIFCGFWVKWEINFKSKSSSRKSWIHSSLPLMKTTMSNFKHMKIEFLVFVCFCLWTLWDDRKEHYSHFTSIQNRRNSTQNETDVLSTRN